MHDRSPRLIRYPPARGRRESRGEVVALRRTNGSEYLLTGLLVRQKCSEEGRLREEVCTRRIEELSAELMSLDARRAELAEEISESQPSVPDPDELAEPVGDIERALRDGALPERKAVMQAVVAEIRVRDRGHIQPVFRVPILGPPHGLVHPTGQKSKGCLQVDGHAVHLSGRHAKLRVDGYPKARASHTPAGLATLT